jgi:hypothetical protein
MRLCGAAGHARFLGAVTGFFDVADLETKMIEAVISSRPR